MKDLVYHSPRRKEGELVDFKDANNEWQQGNIVQFIGYTDSDLTETYEVKTESGDIITVDNPTYHVDQRFRVLNRKRQFESLLDTLINDGYDKSSVDKLREFAKYIK